jgi:3-keto steroid reductase
MNLTYHISGVGLAIAQRLVDEFLATRSLSSHLILIPTTRTAKKSSETIESLRSYLANAAQSKKLYSRVGESYDPQSSIDRVHILSAELDLCKLPTIYEATAKLARGKVRDPTGVIAGGKDVDIPRIDVAILNAGYGGWSGVDWLGLIRQFLAVGMTQATTFPSFKMALSSNTLPPQDIDGSKLGTDKGQPELAEVFTANVFGHYIFAHELMPLFSRSNPSDPPARIVWTSSIDAEKIHLDFNDFQALHSHVPYESSKRLTDVICLSAELPSVQKASSSYYSSPLIPSGSQTTKPRFYLTHPGVVCTPLFPLNWFLYYGYYLAMYISRFLGSPWHTVESYIGAVSATWLALASQEELDAQNAHRVKWGSTSDRLGRAAPKKTEVEGWGWEGRIEDADALRRDESQGILRKLKGRKWVAVELTEEKRIQFEEDASRCWTELEKLRREWEIILGHTGADQAEEKKPTPRRTTRSSKA